MSFTPQELAMLRIADKAEEARKRKHPRPGRPLSGDGKRREQKRAYYLRKKAAKS